MFNINLFMAGRVIVEAESEDTELDVEVLMTDIPAFHDMATGATLKVNLLIGLIFFRSIWKCFCSFL